MKKKVVAIVPIKLNNKRLPGKNTRLLGDKPLIQYILNTLKKVEAIDEIVVYCSDKSICNFFTNDVTFIKRPKFLDESTSNFTQIFENFVNTVDADIYVYAHATAPFITSDTINSCLASVQSGEYDSSFTATKIQDYLWKNGQPLNFDAANIPRSQDLENIYRETSGVYVFTKKVFQNYKRRIGLKPYIKEVSYKEAVDINNPEDFDLADALVNFDI